MSSVDKILGGYDALQADQEAFCKDLHQHPELSHAEYHTAERVAGRLQEYGFTVGTGIGGAGGQPPSRRSSATTLWKSTGRR